MFENSIVALITPMQEDGKLDKNGLKNLIDYHIQSGTSAILILGTTGEYSTLHVKERKIFTMWSLELIDGRVPLLVGIIENSTDVVISTIHFFKNIGISGYLIAVPYYNQPNQEGIYQHFFSIAKEIDVPFLLYNVPSRTGCDISIHTIKRLSKIEKIIGMKESSTDLSRIQKIKSLVEKNFILLSGNDDTALDFMQLGGNGVISVTANFLAREILHLCKLARKKCFLEARNLNNILLPIYSSLLCEPNPSSTKWICKKIGLITSDFVRLPILRSRKSSIKILNQVIKDFNLKK